MPTLRNEEQWAAQTISSTLAAPVQQHDGGSRAGMHEPSIRCSDGRLAAVEVTAAPDGDSMELWKIVNGADERWLVPSLNGGWLVALRDRF